MTEVLAAKLSMIIARPPGILTSCRKPDRGSERCPRVRVRVFVYVYTCALIMQVVVVLIAFLLPLDGLAFSWPRQTKETTDEQVETSIPEGLSSLGGLDRSSLCIR
jgi:hypothetical protein